MTTYNDIKKHLNIKIDKHLNDGFAHLTHFWQNNKNGVSEYYKLSAKEYLQEEILAVAEEPEQLYIPFKYDVPFPPTSKPKFKFIDLFAGIGGIRLAYQNLGGKCVYSSEWDEQAKIEESNTSIPTEYRATGNVRQSTYVRTRTPNTVATISGSTITLTTPFPAGFHVAVDDAVLFTGTTLPTTSAGTALEAGV